MSRAAHCVASWLNQIRSIDQQTRVDAVVIDRLCNGLLAAGGMGIYYFLHFDLSEIIAIARYLPVTPAWPVTSETGPVPRITLSIDVTYTIIRL